MTLAPNHLQRLNGSNWLFLLIPVLFLTFSSCDAFKKVQSSDDTTVKKEDKEELDEIQGNTRYNPKTGKHEYTTDLNTELDTIKWTESGKESAPPITSEGVDYVPGDGSTTGGSGPTTAPGGQRLPAYNVAILLPFLTHRFNEYDARTNEKSKLALQFYSGAKMALDELSSKGIRLNVDVLDTKASEDQTKALIQSPTLQKAHLIIGPARSSNVKVVADFARQNFKPFVSPISPSMSVAKDNPYYIQVSPSLAAHCEAITKHAKARYSSDQIVLVCRNKEAEIRRLKYFQRANAVIEGSTMTDRFQEFIVTDQSADFNEMDVVPYIKEDKTTVFVIPSWSNESFIYSFLRKVNLAKGNNEVVVYGMPQWMKYERVSYDYFEQLNLHVSSTTFIDKNEESIKQFRQNFFNRYNMMPSENAYKGYDSVRYFGQMISDFGTRFQDVIDQQPSNSLGTKYRFERIPESDAMPESGTNIDHIENKFVHILKFEDHFFQPAN